MRILHIASEYPPQRVYGLGRYVADLSGTLVAHGHDVHVLTNSMRGLDHDIIEHGVRIHRVDYPPPPQPPSEHAPALAFNLHLQQQSRKLGPQGLGNPEVVVSHDWLTALAGHRIARWLGVPHVWTIHDLVMGKSFGRIMERNHLVVHQIERWAAKSADRILVNSRAVGEEVRHHYHADPTKTKLLPCAIHPEQFKTTMQTTRLASYRQAYARPDELLITYVGRLDLEKGIDTLINAFSIVHRQRPKTKLAIIGTGALDETIRQHIGHLSLDESVELFGYLRGAGLKNLYQVSDVHVCPSHYEPFGLVVAEAMASARAVIASETGGLVDLIHSPIVGRLVPPRNHDALASMIISLVDDPALRRQLGEAAQQRIRTHFSWDTVARTAYSHYRDTISTPSHSQSLAGVGS